MVKLTTGRLVVLIAAAVPMSSVGIAGGVASYFNFVDLLDQESMAVSVVLAGEGTTFVAALVYLLLTLLGQHTPRTVRAALWLLPATGSVAGVALATSSATRVVMAVAPLAMTVAAEGVALVARRVVAFQTNVDLEQQRRSGLLLWHARRAESGGWLGRRLSKAAVWRLTRKFAETDGQISVQLSEVQRYRIAESADTYLAAALSRGDADKAAVRPSERRAELPGTPEPAALPEAATDAPEPDAQETAEDDGYAFIKGVLEEAEEKVAKDPTVKLMTVADVARVKGVTDGTVRSWVSRGRLAVHDRDENGRNLFHPVVVSSLD
jgi:hypothetical protein